MKYRIVHLVRQPGGYSVKQFDPATQGWRRVAWFPTWPLAENYIQQHVKYPIE